MSTQLEVHIVEIICQHLLMEVFVVSMDQRIMITFDVMMTEAKAMYAMKMIMRL
jgi:hypothetical protein